MKISFKWLKELFLKKNYSYLRYAKGTTVHCTYILERNRSLIFNSFKSSYLNNFFCFILEFVNRKGRNWHTCLTAKNESRRSQIEELKTGKYIIFPIRESRMFFFLQWFNVDDANLNDSPHGESYARYLWNI